MRDLSREDEDLAARVEDNGRNDGPAHVFGSQTSRYTVGDNVIEFGRGELAALLECGSDAHDGQQSDQGAASACTRVMSVASGGYGGLHRGIAHLIAPLLARFLTQYPDMALEISLDSSLTDIVAGRYDAGIRAGKRIARDMIAVRVADEMGHPVPVTRGMKNRFATVRMKMGARHFVMKRLPKIADGAARTAPQWQVNYSNWFDMINAVRYDAFELDGEAVSHFGNCISPSTSATTAEKLARRSIRCSSQ